MKNIVSKFHSLTYERRLVVDLLAVLFGIGSWIGINGMFVQLPLLVKSAPEAWNLPSYMSIAVQIANIGPITYAVYRKKFSNAYDKYWVYIMLIFGTLSPLLMAFFYGQISFINDKPRSVAFLILVFFTAIVGCTSSVLFFPFMRHFKEVYLISYFIGEGMSGFIPSILALLQGIGGNPECIENLLNNSTKFNFVHKEPRFDSQIFFLIISFICFISLCSFILLTKLKICREEMISDTSNVKNNYKLESIEEHNPIEINKNIDSISQLSGNEQMLSRVTSSNLLLLMSITCAFGNGVFPSIQSYSCLPYGNTAYHLSVTLGSMANPIACFLAIFSSYTSPKSVSILSSICAIFISYALATSILSPTPPLVNTTEGIVIVVIVWILCIGLVSYIKLSISTIFRTQGGSWMFYCGASSQLGSALGSLISFLLINFTELFVASNPCQ